MNVIASLALVLALAVPALGQPLKLRNDGRTTVVVQTATLTRGKLKSDQPIVLKPGATSEAIELDGDKMVTIYDGRSNRILFQSLQREAKGPVNLSIQPDPRTPGKVKLVAVRAGTP
ncbi:MAG: hypothetical protein ACRC33_27625 [Gemmataceae bacterium]